MLKIAFFTTTRAEFGIMSSFIQKIQKNKQFKVLLFVGGTHLRKEYGNTIDEIKSLGFEITDTFDYIQEGNSNSSIAKSSGQCMIELTRIFDKYDFDIISVLGDRYELIPIVLTSIIYNKPIIHWGGGEFTEGAIDNQIRHMVTKAANIHFVATRQYAKNIVSMGEKPERIYITGSPVIENLKKFTPIPKKELFEDLGLSDNKPVILLTYHPVTIEQKISPLDQIQNLFEAVSHFNFQLVITASNLESNRDIIMNFINNKVKENYEYHYFDSLGIKKYHSLIPHCLFLIGNSSSGIFEAPYFKVPTINIGDRQKGRFMHESVITTNYTTESIIDGINNALDETFRNKLKDMHYEFGNGNASELAIAFLEKLIIDERLIRKI